MTDPGPVNNGAYYLQGINNLDNAEVAGASTASGALITHAAPSGATSQRWKLQASGSYWKLLNVNSNLCLDLVSASTAAGIGVRQATCAAATRQEWTLRRVADGTYFLVNRYSGKTLTMTAGAGSTLSQQTVAGDNRDLIWALRPV
ncbi:RICIN domain-containing protein [Catellatospora bangladeshensis]|uniref:RICIN domain-containing protein n=1 Tax=Catellatospora bangladeshensis TaxID=310355 RepID=UPI003616C2E6